MKTCIVLMMLCLACVLNAETKIINSGWGNWVDSKQEPKERYRLTKVAIAKVNVFLKEKPEAKVKRTYWEHEVSSSTGKRRFKFFEVLEY